MLTIGLNFLIAVAALVAILDYFGIKPKKFPSVAPMSLSRKWKLAIMVTLVAASLSLSAIACYKSFHPTIVEKTVTVTQMEPYQFKFVDHEDLKYHVLGKHFSNEKVVLDDTNYTHCDFTNVTFVYNGTAPFQLVDIVTDGWNITSDNPAVNATADLLYGLHVLNVDILDAKTRKPFDNIVPAKRINPKRRPQP